MIPIRDTIRSKNYPLINNLIIAANVLVYLVELGQGDSLDQFVYIYGLVPARYSLPQLSFHFTTGEQVFSFFSFMFLHGGFLHLLANMWSLYIFGDNVEDRLGSLRYLVFYLLSGLTSGISHLVFNWYSHVPTIGASGAIAGVMGAYFVLFPRARILTLVPIFFFIQFIEIPAYLFLGLWFVIQFLSAAGSTANSAGIAWWSHIGGFIFGILLAKLFICIPETGLTKKIRGMTKKRATPRIQVIRPVTSNSNHNLFGSISITPREALFGARKLIAVPHRFRKKNFILYIPQGVRDGTILRLKGMGKRSGRDKPGDLYLKVHISD